MIIDVIADAFGQLFSPMYLFYLFLGIIIGLIVGFLPGLGGTAGLALVLPFIFGMDPGPALAMMIGLTSVVNTSDTFPSVMMGIPGTAAAQATIVDGFPMAKRGEAARALSAAFSASMIGGVFGSLMLSVAIFAALPIIMAMGFGEQLMLILLALSMVGILTGANAFKGLAACGIGLMIGVIGPAPATAVERLTFDTLYLTELLPLIVIGLGIFAMPEIVDLLRRRQTISQSGTLLGKGWLQGLKDTLQNWWLILRCSTIGVLIGAMPGLGGSVIDWLAYGHAVQTAKDKSMFGKGDVRGVIAPECSNNAKEGGALIPTILFGIPGSGSMALLLGGFILIGIDPGITMVTQNLDLVYVMIWSIAVANIIGPGICFALATPMARLTTIPYAIIAPFMIGLIFFAAFQATRDWGDLIALFVMGTLGVYMKRFGWPRPALIIGFVLSDKVEAAVYQTVQIYGFSFLSHPIVVVLLIMTLLSIIAAVRYKVMHAPLTEEGVHSHHNKRPQVLFFLAVLAFALTVIFDSYGRSFMTAVYPLTASAFTLLMLIPVGLGLFLYKTPHTVFQDNERDDSEGEIIKSNEYYLALVLIGILGVSSLVGFVLGAATFIFTFLRWKAGLSYAKCALGTFGFIMVLGIMSHFLSLEYPQGALQEFMELPWPLQ
ncbi:MAG: tripartite tricarboxylate transporter permease [Rhodospirillales bacterium]